MNIGNLIYSIAENLYSAGITLISLGASISGVYLIGGVLSQPLLYIGSVLTSASARLGVMGGSWEQFYNMVITKLGDSPILSGLIYWANALVAFISNPRPLIRTIVRELFPALETLLLSTYNFIRPYIQQFLDAFMPWWRDIKTKLITHLTEFIYDFNVFRTAPQRWVFERLKTYSAKIGALLLDPEQWLKDRIKIFYPDLWAFVQNPRSFIVDKLIEGLETLTEKYLPRILKIAERILNTLF